MANSTSGTIFGHPRGLYVLFFTELWERFSFYGMKTLLVLYMVNHFFWSQERASSLLGWYAGLAYGLPIVGGFVADRYLGAKRAIILGGILLSAGHILMAVESMPFFYAALGLIIAGVGLLKPNISTQVGTLYQPGDPRRDGAFTIFYMGINLGALIGPLLCDWLRVNYGYGYGFAAAGVGMILGLVVYAIGQRKLVEFQQDVPDDEEQEGGASGAPARPVHPPHVVRDRVIVLLVVFAFVILFWTAFEQSPNAMLLWADKQTNLRLTSTEPPPVTLDGQASGADDVSWWSDPTMTSGQTQSFNPFFIITLAPLFAFFWIWLDRRRLQPSTPTKMVLGLVGVVFAFGVMWPAAHSENGESTATVTALPTGVNVDEEGFVYTISVDGNSTKRLYYGAKRLRYDAGTKTLRMNGVLVDLDRFRLLAQTAPADLIADMKRFADIAKRPSKEERISQLRLTEVVKRLFEHLDRLHELAKVDPVECSREIALLVQEATFDAEEMAEEPWSLSTRLENAPEGLGPVEIKEAEGKDRKTILAWSPETLALTAFQEVNERARTEFLAMAADPEFKKAIDQIYLDSSDFRVSIWWLVAFYLLLTMGELCLSPVGLSLVTKLAPAKNVGLFMGGWFLATAIAEKLAQVFGAWWGAMPPKDYFLIFIVMCGAGAVMMAVLVRPLKRMMHGVH